MNNKRYYLCPPPLQNRDKYKIKATVSTSFHCLLRGKFIKNILCILFFWLTRLMSVQHLFNPTFFLCTSFGHALHFSVFSSISSLLSAFTIQSREFLYSSYLKLVFSVTSVSAWSASAFIFVCICWVTEAWGTTEDDTWVRFHLSDFIHFAKVNVFGW